MRLCRNSAVKHAFWSCSSICQSVNKFLEKKKMSNRCFLANAENIEPYLISMFPQREPSLKGTTKELTEFVISRTFWNLRVMFQIQDNPSAVAALFDQSNFGECFLKVKLKNCESCVVGFESVRFKGQKVLKMQFPMEMSGSMICQHSENKMRLENCQNH